MPKFLFFLLILSTIYSCSRKQNPQKTTITTTVSSEPGTGVVTPKRSDSVAVVKKKAFTPKKKDIIPPSIVVNDKAAKQAVDGRHYYDLLGNRYWKNYRDGKYYLFSQKMYDNPDFEPRK